MRTILHPSALRLSQRLQVQKWMLDSYECIALQVFK